MSDETCECGAPWPCFCGASKPYVQKDATETSTMDYIQSEAERLPGGTAARALAMVTNDSKLSPQIVFTPAVSPPDVVTITISRDCAQYFAERACANERDCFDEIDNSKCAAMDCQLEQACRATLEADNA